jgi:hypothetical protein
MKGLIQWFTNAVRNPTEPAAHFHQGPESTPAVCYDARCGSPHLDVESL